jgi:DNA-3-methyladenine glycosylase I
MLRMFKPFLAMQEEFGNFDRYSWHFVGGSRTSGGALSPSGRRTPPTPTPSTRISNRPGSRLDGSTIISALKQATGMVSDHQVSYPRQAELGGSSSRARASKRA